MRDVAGPIITTAQLADDSVHVPAQLTTEQATAVLQYEGKEGKAAYHGLVRVLHTDRTRELDDKTIKVAEKAMRVVTAAMSVVNG